jgi:hypothetical protein
VNHHEQHVLDLRDKKFTMVGRDILENTTKFTKPTQKLVYVMLCMYANNDTKRSFPSAGTLAKLCGCSDKSVRVAIKHLQEIGLIRVEPQYEKDGKQTSNVYILLEPPDDF